VTSDTLFQAASISKPVSALAALRLVEEGKLSLDENVNDKLRTWKVPDNQFTAQKKVTVRRILSHSAGLTVLGLGRDSCRSSGFFRCRATKIAAAMVLFLISSFHFFLP